MTDPGRQGLAGTQGPLLDGHDLVLLDLDGVVYLDEQPIEHAAQAVQAARDSGLGIAFVTNNAARTPDEVADGLCAMGLPATVEEVVTSAMAAAGALAARLPAAAPVLVVGGRGLRDALTAVGLRPVAHAADSPAAVVQGWAPEVGWSMLAEGMVALRQGADWVATNLDATLPSPRGPLPGNGSLVSALVTATGRRPESVGKPARAMLDVAVERTSAQRPIAVGDRLETDIEGARAAGMPSLLVLTGVTDAADLLAAPPQCRPDHVGRDLRALALAHPRAEWGGNRVTVGSATAYLFDGGVAIEREDTAPETADGLDGLRALCSVAWSLSPDGDSVAAALRSLNLD